ncbi:hypothetical protein D920_00005 [Enterococcus faecalis 13-SD-W-01]|nr:hypothetical protein D920_00005 [Enterococcus faecalis 13-SD-W-01]
MLGMKRGTGGGILTEIDQLLVFMRKGRRKTIHLADYIQLQEKKGAWSKKRGINLRRELSYSS